MHFIDLDFWALNLDVEFPVLIQSLHSTDKMHITVSILAYLGAHLGLNSLMQYDILECMLGILQACHACFYALSL